MKIITNPIEIDQALVGMIKKYKNYFIATAWASLGSKASLALLKNRNRIKKMVVGIHFYQTHPNFIKEFINSESVKFILKTSGVYHPKAYLFYNSPEDWECIIGSANFTESALSKNSEIVVHLKSSDPYATSVYETLTATINNYWEKSESVDKNFYKNYINVWKKNQKKVKKLSEQYGRNNSNKPLVKSKLFTLTWDKYFKQIKNDKFHSFKGRIELLDTVQSYFEHEKHFYKFEKIQRREVAGIATSNQSESAIEWGWFGSMIGSGKFQNRINSNNVYISDALDCIPLHGEIDKTNYNCFVNYFNQAFPDGGSGVAIASRLLAMKRPDYFVCIDKQNRTKLCDEFGLPKSVSFESYWDDIIERILDSIWWNSKKPSNTLQAKAWNGRVAMLDAIFYEEK
ncbi:phospholipase D family protein [Desulforhopalus singaporensis]|uniref:PLD-like domain-containing protein n=1 Tax=Desulforhopalus singaporensis TaxID=91360 RepID=A0A1H0U5K3_9BACT|nr:phospholipase D family protein [Desulforhopalus singaporensis]SDP61258.1 PLD-like domain-containing protein [Desulforhopalus singaporensis]